MPERFICSHHKDFQVIRRCGDNSRLPKAINATEGLPTTPARAIPPSMPYCLIGAHHKDIDTVGSPGHSGRSCGQNASERLPTTPARAVPPFVVQCIIGATHKTSMRPGPQDSALIHEFMTPPRLSQPPQVEPFHHLCHIALSVPCTKMSMRPTPQDTTAGASAVGKTPPRDFHPLQVEPFHHLCHIALSVPRTKTSMRLGPQDTAEGVEVRTPPRDSQPLQVEPFHHLCHRALSVPCTKISRRLGPQDTTVGA